MSSDNSHSISRMAMKAMGLFGGVQIVGILCSILRTKLVAVWIGPTGVGLFGIFNRALEMLNVGTNLSIRQSSVRDISQAAASCENGNNGGDQPSALASIIAAVRHWSLWLGMAGALITLALAPTLSKLSFGDYSHIWGFVLLSAAVFLMAVTNGEYAVFQGTARLRRLASVTMWGSLCGLVVSIPLFYFLRERSILPSIIAYAAACAIWAVVLRNRDFSATKQPAKQSWAIGKGFVKLGVFMTLGNFVSILSGYIFIAWLNNRSGTAEVGYYQAGYTLINKYTGLILTALGMEYYPRLAKVADDRAKLGLFVSQEINLTMTIMAAFVTVFILFCPQIITLLYSSEFNGITTFVSLGMIGMVYRTLSWCIAFVILAKGYGKTYFITELISAIVELSLNIFAYLQWGLAGLGVAFIASYVIYTAIVAWVCLRQYSLPMLISCIANVVWATAAGVLIFTAIHFGMWKSAAFATAATCLFTLRQTYLFWKK